MDKRVARRSFPSLEHGCVADPATRAGP